MELVDSPGKLQHAATLHERVMPAKSEVVHGNRLGEHLQLESGILVRRCDRQRAREPLLRRLVAPRLEVRGRRSSGEQQCGFARAFGDQRQQPTDDVGDARHALGRERRVRHCRDGFLISPASR